MRKYDYLMRTRALCLSANTVGISEQEVWGMSKTDLAVFPCQTVPKKYPRRISPRIMIYYAPIAKAIRQARQARRRRSPCRLSVCFARCAVFGVLHCPNRAQKQSHTHDAKTKPKANTTEKQKQGTSKAGKRHILKRDYEKASKKGNRQAKTERANKHKQESLQGCLLL